MASRNDSHYRGLKSSRYYGLPTVQVETRQGRTVTALTLRLLPPTEGEPYTAQDNDRLDLIANRSYQDATRFWHIADANTELEAGRLIEPGREIVVPKTR